MYLNFYLKLKHNIYDVLSPGELLLDFLLSLLASIAL